MQVLKEATTVLNELAQDGEVLTKFYIYEIYTQMNCTFQSPWDTLLWEMIDLARAVSVHVITIAYRDCIIVSYSYRSLPMMMMITACIHGIPLTNQ